MSGGRRRRATWRLDATDLGLTTGSILDDISEVANLGLRRDIPTVRIRLTDVLLAGIALAALVAGASAGNSFEPHRAEITDGVRQSDTVRIARRAGAAPPTDISSAPKKKAEKPDKSDNKPAAKQQPPTRPEFTAAEAAVAQIPELPGVRFWADSTADFEKALPTQEGPWLILSTGGEEGAYGAGFLNGWSQSGTRPEFAVVTGVSTGALMATYVFAGAKYDEELHNRYTTISASDIFEVASTPESLTDTWPLADLIKKGVTPELLADIAAAHQKGRRLFVLTTDLDAGKAVVWNMGAIAAHGGDAALKLYRQILLASAAVPGVFPPVYITAEANGHQFQEMHADGGISGPLFFAPVAYLVPGSPKRLPASALYVIVNGKLSPEFYLPQRNTAAILGRSITLALKAGGRLQLVLASMAAKQAGIPFNLAYVDDAFAPIGQGLFDPAYMKALYDNGVEQARSENRFHSGPPTPALPSPTASGGSMESKPK
jgi:Patatin-like phospholipase